MNDFLRSENKKKKERAIKFMEMHEYSFEPIKIQSASMRGPSELSQPLSPVSLFLIYHWPLQVAGNNLYRFIFLSPHGDVHLIGIRISLKPDQNKQKIWSWLSLSINVISFLDTLIGNVAWIFSYSSIN